MSAAGIPAWADTAVNTCGQVLQGEGFLSADLDCSATGAVALFIGEGTLALGGFTLTGAGIACEGSCAIIGPGTVALDVDLYSPPVGPGAREITGDDDLRLVNLVGSFSAGVVGEVSIEGSQVTGSIYGDKRTRVYSSTIEGAVGSDKFIRVDDSQIIEGRVYADRVTLRSSSIVNSPYTAVLAWRSVRAEDSTIVNAAYHGIDASSWADCLRTCCPARGKVKAQRMTISGSGLFAVYTWRSASIKDSEITDNVRGGIFSAAGTTSCGRADGGRVLVTGTVVSDGDVGIVGTNTNVSDSSITGWRRVGVWAKSFGGAQSEVASTALDPECGVLHECPDIASFSRPFQKGGLVCENSRKLTYFSWSSSGGIPSDPGPYLSNEAWGTCSLD